MAFGIFGGPSADGGYGGDSVAQRRRAELREFGSRLSDHGELRGCGRTIRKGRGRIGHRDLGGDHIVSTQVALPDVRLHRVVEGGSQAEAPTTWLDGARRRGGLAHPHPISLPRRRFGHAVVALGGGVGGAGAGVGLDSRQTGLWCARLRSHHGACSQRSGGLECALSRDPAPGPRTGSAAHASAASFPRCEVRSRRRAQWRSRGGGSARLATDDAGDRGTVGQLSLQGNQVGTGRWTAPALRWTSSTIWNPPARVCTSGTKSPPPSQPTGACR